MLKDSELFLITVPSPILLFFWLLWLLLRQEIKIRFTLQNFSFLIF